MATSSLTASFKLIKARAKIHQPFKPPPCDDELSSIMNSETVWGIYEYSFVKQISDVVECILGQYTGLEINTESKAPRLVILASGQ